MLVLISNFQGATITPIVPIQKHFLLFTTKFASALQFKNYAKLFSTFLDAVKAKCKI